MKVVERKEWQHEFTCSCCGSVLVAETKDVKSLYHEDDPNEYYVECPVCKTTKKLKDKELSPLAVETADAERHRRR